MVKLVSNAPNLDDIPSFTITGDTAEFVYRQGEAGRDLFLIQEGQIEILSREGSLGQGSPGNPGNPGNEDRQLEILGPGDFFGELSWAEDRPRAESARAVTPYRLLRIDRSTFHQLVQENPDIALRMIHRVAQRLRVSNDMRLRAAPPASSPPAPRSRPERVLERPSVPESPSPEPVATAGPRTATLVHRASGTEFPLECTGELIVGRIDRARGFTPEIDLTELDPDRTLSRRHATISGRDDGLYLCESKATSNGTFLNGHRIDTGVAVKLNDGDRLRFGAIETILTLR
jgi:CRP-like cAMP-binding protein